MGELLLRTLLLRSLGEALGLLLAPRRMSLTPPMRPLPRLLRKLLLPAVAGRLSCARQRQGQAKQHQKARADKRREWSDS